MKNILCVLLGHKMEKIRINILGETCRCFRCKYQEELVIKETLNQNEFKYEWREKK